jgi:GNAT superfamily N-acetyltransferase
MKPEINIVRVTEVDQEQIDELCRLRDALEVHHNDFSTSDLFRNFLLKHMGEESMLVFLMCDEGKAMGYGMAFDVEEHPFMPEWTRRGYITQYFVDSAYRGKGLGELGLSYIHDWFCSRGLTNVMLNVDMENEIGVHFWSRQGYVPYATRMKHQLDK